MKVIVVSNINSPTLDSLHCCTNVIENMFGIKLADAADIRKDRLILQVIQCRGIKPSVIICVSTSSNNSVVTPSHMALRLALALAGCAYGIPTLIMLSLLITHTV